MHSKPRLERKYLVVGDFVDEVELAIEQHPAGFRKVYPRREVRTVYFDSQTLGHYTAAVEGEFYRIKPRVRWYVEEGRKRPVQMEVKEKRGELGRKKTKSVRINRSRLADKDYLEARIRKEGLVEYIGTQPVLLVSYVRDYYQTADGRVRLTMDQEIGFKDLLMNEGGVDDKDMVVELKYKPNNEREAERVAQGLPFSLTKISKYVRGVGYFLVVVLIGLVGVGQARADNGEIVEGINGRELSVDDGGYSFLLVGHAYGSPSIESGWPASTLIGNVERINEMGVDFVVLLGDVVQHSTIAEFENLNTSLLSPLGVPVFNAPGNHELSNRELYESTFGETHRSFTVGSELFLVIDTGLEGEVGKVQIEFIKNEIKGVDGEGVKNVVVLSHRLFWLADGGELEELAGLTNRKAVSNEDRQLRSFFWELMQEVEGVRFYFLAGDIGAWGDPSLLYQERGGVVMAATGLGDTTADAVIKVTVDEGRVGFETLSLTGSELTVLSDYSGDYWREKLKLEDSQPDFGDRVMALPNKRSFWVGLLAGFGLSLVFGIGWKTVKSKLTKQP